MYNNWKLEERAKNLADACEGKIEEVLNELIEEVELAEDKIIKL